MNQALLQASKSNQDFDPEIYVLVYCCLFMDVLVLPYKHSLSSPSLAFFLVLVWSARLPFRGSLEIPKPSCKDCDCIRGLRVQCSASVVEHGRVGWGWGEHVSVWRVRDDEVDKEKKKNGTPFVERSFASCFCVCLFFLFFSQGGLPK